MALFYPHYYYHLPKLINLLVLSFWVTSLGPLMVNIAGNISVFMIPKCVARVPVSLRGSGVEGVFAGRCVHDRNRSQPFAPVRNRSRETLLEVSSVALLRFAWQAWHFVTFRHVSQRVENRFVPQTQYFCDVLGRCVAFFVADAALWRCLSSFCVTGATL